MSAEDISVDVLNIGRAVQTELQRVIYGQAVAIQSLLVAVAAGIWATIAPHISRPPQG